MVLITFSWNLKTFTLTLTEAKINMEICHTLKGFSHGTFSLVCLLPPPQCQLQMENERKIWIVMNTQKPLGVEWNEIHSTIYMGRIFCIPTVKCKPYLILFCFYFSIITFPESPAGYLLSTLLLWNFHK